MINLNNYIIEKFKITKDIDTSADAEYYSEFFSPGDICLMVRETGLNIQKRIIIEVVEVKKSLKTKFEVKRLTNLGCTKYTRDTIEFKIKLSENTIKGSRHKYLGVSGMTSTTIFIPKFESEKFLKLIKDENCELDFYHFLWGGIDNYEKDSGGISPVCKIKDESKNNYDLSYKDYEKVSESDIDELLKYF